MKNFKNIRNENINKMKLIDKMKKASPAAKKALEAPSRVEDVRSADKKAETYIKPDGKAGIRMVPVDKTVMKKEDLDEAKTDVYHKTMLKALGKTRLPKGHGNTSSVANNGDFVVANSGGRVIGRLKKGEFVLPSKNEQTDELNELTAAEKKLINQMYDKKGNLTPMGKKVMDHGKANSKLTPKNRDADNARRKEYNAYQKSKRNEEVDLDEAPRRKGAPKMTGDSVAIQRAKDAAHNAAMGRTKTGRKKPVRTMTSTQKSLASMRREAVEVDEAVLLGRDYEVKDGNIHITKAKLMKVPSRKKYSDGSYSMMHGGKLVGITIVKEMNKPSSDYMAKMDKIPVSQMTPAQKKANSERRKEYKAYQMKKGITPFVPHPDKVKEENLNELSPEVRQSYRKKAMANRNKADLDRTMGLMNRAKGKGRSTEKDIKKADDTLAKRNRGQALFNKQKAKNLPKSSNIIKASKDQEVETQTQESNLNELSPKTMGRYVGAASTSLKTAAQKSGSGSYATQAARRNRYKDLKTATKRKRGIDMAADKLSRESVAEMSDMEKTRSLATSAGLKTKTPDQKKKAQDQKMKNAADRPNPEMLGAGKTFDAMRKAVSTVKNTAKKVGKTAVIGAVAGAAASKLAGF